MKKWCEKRKKMSVSYHCKAFGVAKFTQKQDCLVDRNNLNNSKP